jgi:hypothetical protein
MSNFICVNGSLRFDRVQLHFVRICYSLPVYQRLTSGLAYSPLTQDILSHALPACRLGEGAMPHCDVFAGKNRHHQLGSTSAMPISRAPSSPVDGRCAGGKIETAGEQNVPWRWVPCCGLTPPCFFGHGCGPEPREPTIDAGEPAEPQRRQRKHGSFHHPGVPF